LNKQWQTAKSGWFASLGIGQVANNAYHKNEQVAKMLRTASTFECHLKLPNQWNTDMRLLTWTMRCLYR
jgi:hypothetical protein